MIRLLIVHDRSILTEGLRMLLSAEPDVEVVGEAVDDKAAVWLAAQLDPDVALVDADMCHNRGLAVARALSVACPHIRILMLSLHDDPETRAGAAQAGACGFVSKQTPTEMLAAIRTSGR